MDSTHTYALPSNLQRKTNVTQSAISRNGFKQPVQQHTPYNLLPVIAKKTNDSCARVRPFVPGLKNSVKNLVNFKTQNNIIPPHHNYYQPPTSAFQASVPPVTRRVQLPYSNIATSISTNSSTLSRPVSFSTAQQSPQIWQNNGNSMQYTTHYGLNGQPLAKVQRRFTSSPQINGNVQMMGHQQYAQGFSRTYAKPQQQGAPPVMRTIFVRKKY